MNWGGMAWILAGAGTLITVATDWHLADDWQLFYQIWIAPREKVRATVQLSPALP